MEFVGKNKSFIVRWDCSKQYYTVYYNNKLLIDKLYKFSQVKSYLN